MEEEINYSTLVFKSGGAAPQEKKEDPTIYSEVKSKDPASTVTEKKGDPAISSKLKPEGPSSTLTDVEAAVHSDFRVLAVCLGIFCVLLVVCVSAIVYIGVVMTEQKANLRDLTAEKQQLIMEKSILERQTEELSRATSNLTWMLSFILTFDTFPVTEYCPEKKCQPCQKDWILFQEKCYLFYNELAPWKTWGNSQKYCQQRTADLVVIDSLQEQEFISNHTEYYYDHFHGFWFGLHETDDEWLWVDGRNDTLKYWIKEDLGSPGSCALVIPGKIPTASWDPAGCVMQSKFICESEALIRKSESESEF
ncbi:C-type lectin domain family 7 member A-like [Enoplosus armatus]|uniref:C-type lectin domain family 7 member A-like n=1 Tax=Enoplosus armatus TaxID=215367 RepID=UPI003991C850